MNENQRSFNWYAIYTKPRHEFKVRDILSLLGIETFVPSIERIQRWSDRKRRIIFPLFSCYLFVHTALTYGEKLKVLRVPGVIKFVSIRDNVPEPIPEEQIFNLKKALESKEQIDPYPYLREGMRVRVKKGPLAGVMGVLVEKKEGHFLVISVDVIQHGAALKIDASFVEVV